MVSAAHKRRAVRQVVEGGLCSVRSACRMLHLHRSSFRYEPLRPTEWERRLHGRVEVLSCKHPRLGYKKLTRMLVGEGWRVGKKLVQRLRREMRLKVRPKRPRVRRRGRSSGPQPTRAREANHVWSWDFIHDRTDNGAKLKILSLVDEHTRECLALHAAREMNAGDVRTVLERVIAKRGAPSCIRSDNGPEFIAKELQAWLAGRQIQTLYIEPGSPWQNGFVERLPAPSGAALRAACGRLLAPLESMAASGTNAWIGNSCSAWPRHEWSSRTTVVIATPSARMADSAT